MVVIGLDDRGWNAIRKLIERDLGREGFELADLQFNRAKGRFLLRIFIDHENGVTIDDCERVSQRISASLDRVDLIHGPYLLEVSSPGLDRPLKRKRDYERVQGHWIQLSIMNPEQKTQSLEGKIIAVDDEGVTIEDRKGVTHPLPFSLILNARLIIDFKTHAQGRHNETQ